ncbi:MAG: DEAD/DEAH box helicase [Chthonomonadaceae bacterium]|nr:DEAD/DEAH box helicase [Chthonomonadaceae bacterium]
MAKKEKSVATVEERPESAALTTPVAEPEIDLEIETPLASGLPAAFAALGLGEPLLRAIAESGFTQPTPIQSEAIPFFLTGRDLIGQAQTGTGKTAAFALPLAQLIDPDKRKPQAIVLLPTRELCLQVSAETRHLSKFCRIRVVAVYGGQPIDRQFRALEAGAHIVVGTPGRVLDHIRRGTLDLSDIQYVALDEADEMLQMGFIEDVEEILKSAPKQRQTALFSATMPPRIAALANETMKNPYHIKIQPKERTVARITQTYYEVPNSRKQEALLRILDMEEPKSAIIFCKTKKDVDDLGEALQNKGFNAETLHGDMNQTLRDRVMGRFRSGKAEILVATDVAARGLDIDQVTHVFNFDLPWDTESYIHRIGRTGRAGRSGDAITLVTPRDRHQIKMLEKQIKAPIGQAQVPTPADIARRHRERFQKEVEAALELGDFDREALIVEAITEKTDWTTGEIAAAAMNLLWKSRRLTDFDLDAARETDARAEVGMVRIFLQIGRFDNVRPGDIVGAIANEAGLSGKSVGAIEIFDRSSYVEVPERDASRVISALNNTKLRGRKVRADVARPKDDR